MKSESREKILAALDAAPPGKAGGAIPAPPPRDETALCRAEARTRFRLELEKLSGEAHIVPDRRSLSDAVGAIIRRQEIKRAVRWRDPLFETVRLDDLLRKCGVDVYTPGEDEAEFRAKAAEADLGITTAHGILFETGTVAVEARRGCERLSSLLPPVHVVIAAPDVGCLRPADILAGLALRQAAGEELPSAVYLVSGPSRTADIELALVLGAHGPRALYVLLLEEDVIES